LFIFIVLEKTFLNLDLRLNDIQHGTVRFFIPIYIIFESFPNLLLRINKENFREIKYVIRE